MIELGGEDRITFLQGLVSNDVTQARPGHAVWAALLTPQGKWLADFFILADAERLLLDCERGQVAMLMQRLSRFRLRSKATLRLAEELCVYAAWDGALTEHGISAPDPRLPEAGLRLLSATPLPTTALEVDWDRHRLALGLPDGSRDLEAEKTVLLEAGFDELNGILRTKGCYMGQELTARTKYRGLVKRRLVPVGVSGALPAPGSPCAAGRRGGRDDAIRAGSVGAGAASDRSTARHTDLQRRDADAASAHLDAAPRHGVMSESQVIDWESRYRGRRDRLGTARPEPRFPRLARRGSAGTVPDPDPRRRPQSGTIGARRGRLRRHSGGRRAKRYRGAASTLRAAEASGAS